MGPVADVAEIEPAAADARRTGAAALPGVSVVIPCLNEEASIAPGDRGRPRRDRRRRRRRARSSSSTTAPPTARWRSRRRHGARVLTETHRGYGSALRKGFANARHEIVVMGDGDLTYDFTKLGDLVRPILAGEARVRHRQPDGEHPARRDAAAAPLHRQPDPLGAAPADVPRPAGAGRPLRHARHHAATPTGELRCVTTGMEFASEMVVQAIQQRRRASPSGTSSTTRASGSRSSSRSATAGATCAS